MGNFIQDITKKQSRTVQFANTVRLQKKQQANMGKKIEPRLKGRGIFML